jgi:hypothetical protein
MPSASAPFGFVPTYHPSGEMKSVAHTGILLPGTNVQISKFQPVAIAIGTGATVNGVTVATGQAYLAPVIANNVDFWGVFAGCEYFDATGKPTESNYWPAGQTCQTGTMVTAWIWEDPDIVYEAQVDGSIAIGGSSIAQVDGKQTNISNFSANGSGLSQATLSASLVATAAQGQFTILKLSPSVLNQSIADAYPIVQCSIARQTLRANKVSI